MVHCFKCEKDVGTFATGPEFDEVCSDCGLVLSENLVSTCGSSSDARASLYRGRSHETRINAVFLASICHLFGLSGAIEEATAILDEMHTRTSLRLTVPVYGAAICIVLKKRGRHVNFRQVAVKLFVCLDLCLILCLRRLWIVLQP
jgi:hypothetical protein